MTRIDRDPLHPIITHNPITMARMNCLYGGHHGQEREASSQLVSVDLGDAVKLREAG